MSTAERHLPSWHCTVFREIPRYARDDVNGAIEEEACPPDTRHVAHSETSPMLALSQIQEIPRFARDDVAFSGE